MSETKTAADHTARPHRETTPRLCWHLYCVVNHSTVLWTVQHNHHSNARNCGGSKWRSDAALFSHSKRVPLFSILTLTVSKGENLYKWHDLLTTVQFCKLIQVSKSNLHEHGMKNYLFTCFSGATVGSVHCTCLLPGNVYRSSVIVYSILYTRMKLGPLLSKTWSETVQAIVAFCPSL